MKRLLTLSAAVLALHTSFAVAEEGVTDSEIRLVTSMDLSANLKEQGNDLKFGSEMYFKMINDQGGVNGRKISFKVLDDGYKPDVSLKNAKAVMEGPSEGRPFVWFEQFGTGSSMQVIPYVTEKRVPFLFPYSGSPDVRNKGRYVFNFRASYEDEMERLVDYSVSTGVREIVVVYQDDAFGKAGLAGVEKALAKRKIKLVAKIPVKGDGSDAEAAVAPVNQSESRAIIISGAGTLVNKFMKAYTASGAASKKVFAMSILNSKSLSKEIGAKSYGVIQTQITPHPKSEESALVAEAKAVFAKYKVPSSKLNYTVLEGFVNARVLVDGIRIAGRDLTREKFVSALESLGNKDAGGMVYGFSPTNHDGARFVDLTIVDKNGDQVE